MTSQEDSFLWGYANSRHATLICSIALRSSMFRLWFYNGTTTYYGVYIMIFLANKYSYNWPRVSPCRPWALVRGTAVWSHAPSCSADRAASWSRPTARCAWRGHCECWCLRPGSCWRVVRRLRRRPRWWGVAGIGPRAPRIARHRPWWHDRPVAATAVSGSHSFRDVLFKDL